MRLTKIICTLGPSSKTLDHIRALAEAGMNIARINLSHGTRDSQRELLHTVKKLNEEGYGIATMIDTQGPEIRTGDVKEPIMLEKDQEVLMSYAPVTNAKQPVIHVNYDGFAEDVRNADIILIDNGELRLKLLEVKDGIVVARTLEAGKIGSRRHVNLPGADIRLPSITDKDWEDLAMGIEEKADFVALSFVRTGGDVREAKKFLRENGSDMQVVSKIETHRAVENLEDILEATDGIMVARGDLGAEIPFERVPAIQDELVSRCRSMGKPVIVATHMLESMIQNPTPTRAEVTDVSHAATTRADCTMLSGESASGKHPLEAVRAMDRILRETESRLPAGKTMEQTYPTNEHTARAEAASVMAASLDVPAIIVLTRSGGSARSISKCRPTMPIIALTDTPQVQRQLQMSCGVHPLSIKFSDDPETTVKTALAEVRRLGLVQSGERIVLVSDTKTSTGIATGVQVRMMP